jgi:rubrerythrin
MEKNDLLSAIKAGMKGELDSVNLYQNAYDNAEDPAVKNFLQERVEEEKRHYNYLLHYFKEISKGKELTDFADLNSETGSISSKISREFILRIAEKQVLFSSMSTAALLEKNAMDHYLKCYEATEEPELKEFFKTMYNWESKHYEEVLQIQKEAEEIFWDENRFQPF